MEVTLLPATAARVRAVLGEGADLTPSAVPEALARLAVEAPDVYSQVLAEISGSHIRLDSERVLLRRRRRGLIRRALLGWAEYKSDAGDWVVAKRRVAAAVPLGAAAILAIVLAVSAVGHHARSSRAAVVSAASLPAVPRGPRPLGPQPPRLPLLPPAPGPAAALPSGRGSWSGEAVNAAGSLGVLRPVPALPPVSVLSLGGDVVRAGDPLISSVVYTRSGSGGGRTGDRRDSGDAAGMPLAVRTSPIVYDRGQSGPKAASAAASPDASGSTSGGAPGQVGTPSATAQSTAPSGNDGRGDNPSRGPGDLAVSAGVISSGAGAQLWRLGQRVPVRLVTGVIATTGGSPSPVFAESQGDDTLWLGSAVLGADGLIQITFSPATPSGTRTVRGVALDLDTLAPGLRGRTVVRQRRAAAAAVSAAVAAAADYAQAAARNGQVTIGDGWAQFGWGTPGPAWTYLASRIASEIGGRSGVTVETTEIAAGTPCTVLIVEAR